MDIDTVYFIMMNQEAVILYTEKTGRKYSCVLTFGWGEKNVLDLEKATGRIQMMPWTYDVTP